MLADLFRQLSTGLIGAVLGVIVAWILESAGYSPLAIYLLVATLFGTWLFVDFNSWVGFGPVRHYHITLMTSSKVLLVLSVTGIYFGIEAALDINPRDYVYLPLVPLIIVCTALFGLGSGLFATILSVTIADYFYVPNFYSFEILEWEDSVGLVIFAIAGSVLAFGVHKLCHTDGVKEQ
jgi:hypothetical protein